MPLSNSDKKKLVTMENLEKFLELLENRIALGNEGSYVGMVIQSTTLADEGAVKAVYGGESWTQISGRFLIGAGSGKDTRNETMTFAAGSTGGEYKHVLTVPELATHRHTPAYGGNFVSNAYPNQGGWGQIAGDGNMNMNGGGETSSTGSNSPHNNMPPYKTVYIWERTA